MTSKLRQPIVKSTLTIFLCFLLTSTGHLSWMYHMMTMAEAELSSQVATAAGYAAQAAGIGVFALLIRYSKITPRVICVASLILYAVCLVPSVLSKNFVWTVVFGLMMSVICGIIAGYYLYDLTKGVGERGRAISFGIGYGVSTIASWLFSLIDHGSVYYGNGVMILCMILTALAALSVFLRTEEAPLTAADQKAKPKLGKLLILSCMVVLVFSLVNNIGFSFSAAQVQGGLRPEFSRVFYAVGLVSAGFVTDRSRKYGAVCALAALVIPFIVLALRGEPVSSTIFWGLGYLAFGFYSVYRVILFSDLASGRGLLYLSGMGLLIGRIGDALGSEISILLSKFEAVMVIMAAFLFVIAVFLFIRLFQMLYVSAAARQKSEQEIFAEFAARHDLSGREREVLRLLLQEKTNKEISEQISVSESTVKFHIHNLLSKTGCKSRMDLKNSYYTNRV